MAMCRGPREWISMLLWLIRFAWRRVGGASRPAVATLRIMGLSFTLDWAAAEHVPLREIIGRAEYWPTAAFQPSPGQVVVDVGANAGVFATVAAAWIGPTGRLVAIEPNPGAAARLRTNLHQNGLDARSVVIEAGLSDHAGRATMYVGSNSTIGTLSDQADSSMPGIEIQVGTLDAIANDLHISAIDLLKVDVEGLEVRVLDGASVVLPKCRRAVIEVSNKRDVLAVMERCSAAGFDRVVQRPAGADSGATIVFAERR
jgi:FkbM family methyltransferase